MKYFFDIDFSKNKKVGAFQASISLIKNTRKRHHSSRCMTRLFSFSGYNIILQSCHKFNYKSEVDFYLEDMLRKHDEEYILNLITQFNDEPYNNESFAKLYIKSDDMKTVLEINELKENPIETLCKYLPEFKNLFLVESKIKDF